MTPTQKLLVKRSWETVMPMKETASDIFYNHLFDEYPEVKAYFKADIKVQELKLMMMINTVVHALDNLETLIEPIKRLGMKHVEYGVKKDDYDKVCASLLWTLEQILKDDFTADVHEAWTVIYTLIANHMIDGAEY